MRPLTYNVIVTPTADAAAMEAVAWYAERSTDAAQQWHERITHPTTAWPSCRPAAPCRKKTPKR